MFTAEANVLSANRRYNFVGQFCFAVVFAALIGSMQNSVELIAGSRVPPQIFKSVVGPVSVGEMTGLHAVTWWTNKSFEDQTVNELCDPLTIAVQADLEIAELRHPALNLPPDSILALCCASSQAAKNFALRSDRIAGEIGNVTYFHVTRGCGKRRNRIVALHGAGLLGAGVVKWMARRNSGGPSALIYAQLPPAASITTIFSEPC